MILGVHDYSLSLDISPPEPSSGFLAFVTSIPSDTIPIMRTSLRLEDRAERRRFVFVCSFVAAVFVAVVVVTGLIMWMAFFGDDAQRAVAQTLGKGGLFGLAGYAVVSGLMRLVRSLVPNRPGNPGG